jgi:hypothetical protein
MVILIGPKVMFPSPAAERSPTPCLLWEGETGPDGRGAPRNLVAVRSSTNVITCRSAEITLPAGAMSCWGGWEGDSMGGTEAFSGAEPGLVVTNEDERM